MQVGNISVHSIQQLIERNTHLTPNATAASYQEKAITYQELNNKANQLAYYLKKQGLQSEDFVGISINRSIDVVICILGILKAGGVYVPIDPTHPKERINYITEDTQLSMLITEESFLPLFSSAACKKILLDKYPNEINNYPTHNLNFITNTDQLAYILYTSGSTGRPKGVMVTHRNVIHAYHGWKKIYNLSPHDCHLQMANFAFDVFTGDFIRALGSGAKLVLCPRDTLLQPDKLFKLMQEEKINCAEFVPTILRRLIEHIEKNHQRLDFMRLLICGSDNWSIREYKSVQHLASKQTRVINSYGLTEATIDSTYFEEKILTDDPALLNHAVPIGKPFPNTEIYLLDENLQPVKHGEIGEIYISGPGVARGYLNKSDLTRQRFICSPFSQNKKMKLYKTGDQGRYLANGNIEFLGRIDTQIKLRGMRIELSDIENAITCYPHIRECVVIANEDQLQNKRLIAYIVTDDHAKIETSYLRKFLKDRLPEYMIPTFFIKLQALPLTPNGKLDRQSLNIADLKIPQENYVPPRTHVERVLGNIWKKYLGVRKIGINDAFYDIGGNSLLLASILTKAEERLAVNIPLCCVDKNVTIAKLANMISNRIPFDKAQN